ncbi:MULTISPECIES: Uma2 family endonuclease [unclassified Chamaesiphon]|uniref:Uma2 family endonuclease n=1 Tax=unclassified Chamaesiphon TaxID=2620921 RepID=UPI00286A58C3|nr:MULTISPECIES: Uma2 family endonuclease [unclassified Chamaesiphon]
MSITIAKWTIDQYHELVATGILDDRRVELLAGDIVEMPPEGMPHAVYCGRTVEYLRELLINRAKVRETHPITLPNNSEPEPDVAIVRSPDTQYLAHHPYPEDIFWLIEYSDTILAKDINVKQRIYSQAGILEYWVVNLPAAELIVFRDAGNDGYEAQTKLTIGSISPLSFPDIEVEVRRLFSI